MMKKTIGALTIAGLMALQVPMTAFAAVSAEWMVPDTPAIQSHDAINTTTKPKGVCCFDPGIAATVNGDVKVKTSYDDPVVGIQNGAASTIKVLGDISAENTGTDSASDCYGIWVKGGNVEANNVAATSVKNAHGVFVDESTSDTSIMVNGDITVTNNTAVGKHSVDGIFIKHAEADVNVSAGRIICTNAETEGDATGIFISGEKTADTKITVECTGISLAADYTTAVVASTDGTNDEVTIHVNGNVCKATVGADLNNMAGKMEITIDSDLSAEDCGLSINNEGVSTSVAVNGVVSAKYGTAFYVGDPNADNYDVSVYGLKAAEGADICNSEAALAKVNYIVHGSDGSADYKNMTFDPSQVSTVTVNGKTYYTAKEGTITVTVGSGYALKSTQGLAGSGNTYTVTIPQGGFVTLEAILTAVEQEESNEGQKPITTGSIGAPVTDGIWNMAPDGTWTYRTNAMFKNTWAYIGNPYAKDGQAKEGWFYFDKNGIMLTGWQLLDGKWYYFNKDKDGTQGMLFVNTTTPDGYKVGADGALIQ